MLVVNRPAEEKEMSKAIIFVSAGMIGVFLVVSPAGAQVAPQTVELAKVNVQKLAAGYRASRSSAAALPMTPTKPSVRSTTSS